MTNQNGNFFRCAIVCLILISSVVLKASAQDTPTPTPTCTPTATPTETFTPTVTPTNLPVSTATPTPTNTPLQEGCNLTVQPAELWPPNHAFVTVNFFDTQGNPVPAPPIAGIFQDEPTQVIGSGNFCPDARILSDGTVQVRRERTGDPHIPGDGRVYHILFTGTTANGPCTGEVTLCVPHDQRRGHHCVDEGALYNSLVCGSTPGITAGNGNTGGNANGSHNGNGGKHGPHGNGRG